MNFLYLLCVLSWLVLQGTEDGFAVLGGGEGGTQGQQAAGGGRHPAAGHTGEAERGPAQRGQS